MYVVGVSSKLSNTIFTYKMCFLSFLSPLASIFPPFLPQTRGSLASFWETRTSKHPRSALTILLLWIVDLGCQKSRLHQFLNHSDLSHLSPKCLALCSCVRPWAHPVLAVPAKLLWHFHPLGASAGAWPSACHPSLCGDSGLGSSLKPDHWIMQVSSGL